MRTKKNPYIKDVNDYIIDTSNYDTTVPSNESKYEPSLVGQCAVSEYADGIKLHSDIHLLLHDKNIVDKLGVDTVRDYLKEVTSDTTGSFDKSNLTDEQLYSFITERRFNTLTDKYELQRALAADFNYSKSVIEYDERQKDILMKSRQELLDSIKGVSSDVNGGSIQSNNV